MTKLEEIRKKVLECKDCDLHLTKNKYVFGGGDEKSSIMFIGESPGVNEDKEGVPFVGNAGKIFDELLSTIGLERGDIYVTNVIKCRTPGNRNPAKDEIDSCRKYLNAQVDIINPKIICPMGNFATPFIFDKYNIKEKVEGISKMRGKIYKVATLMGQLKIIPLYHPAVATYAPEMKEALLKDMKIVKEETEK